MTLSAEQAVLAAMVICLAGALLTLLLRGRKRPAGWVAFGCVGASSTLVLGGVLQVLLRGPGQAVTFLAIEPLGFALRLYVDGLSSVFLGLIAVVAVPASLYSIDYLVHHAEHGVGRYYPNLLLFLAAMYGLVSTTDMMWFFFIFWQMMTWAGWALIRYERRRPASRRAAAKYLWMMQAACGATMLGAGLLARDEVVTPAGERLLRYDFDAVSHALPALLETHPGVVTLAFGLFLVGFGIKLGMWPFGQIWLPDAHPAAPSPVSALLSGVMIKTGIYGLMRYFLWLVPAEARGTYPLGGWGLIVTGLGTLTLFSGTVQALHQHQSKRLLAFSSIGQGGYLLFGLGVGLTLLGSPHPAAAALAAVAITGALFHTLNHGVFKSLLFLNAGSVLHATGTQDLNKLGGLMRWMPVTAVTAFIGSFSIAGVPLFSGFASKWMLFGAAIRGSEFAPWLAACAMVAIFTSAVTLALFIKFFGVMFLCRTSEVVAARAQRQTTLEVTGSMRLAQVALACASVATGLVPLFAVSVLGRALDASRQGLGAVLADARLASPGAGSALVRLDFAAAGLPMLYAPLLLALVIGALLLFVRCLARLGGSSRRVAAPWLCGYALESEAHRYRADGWYGELKKGFSWLGGKPGPHAE